VIKKIAGRKRIIRSVNAKSIGRCPSLIASDINRKLREPLSSLFMINNSV